MLQRAGAALFAGLVAFLPIGCSGGGAGTRLNEQAAESCMTCHNGSPDKNDYSGPGLENPHPFPGASQIRCSTCHGGNPNGTDKDSSHVPPPPEIGDDQNQLSNATAWFNALTLDGIDKYADYTVNGKTYTALDWLRFENPGDLRVTATGQGCGKCHDAHSDAMSRGLLATETGMFSGASFVMGAENRVPQNQGLHQDTAADIGFRAISDGSVPNTVGAVGSLVEFPVYSVRGKTGPDDIFNNPAYDSDQIPNDVNPDNSVVTDSPLANLFLEQVAFTCGDCHLGSKGANNRYGDFRSSGCTSCHMRYSLDGRSHSGDPNVDKAEPANPDAIRAPERPHIERHLVLSVSKTLPSGEQVQGIDDYTCAGCHQGSNRTVMQYWGIRLDQNQDLRNHVQYPADPVTFQSTNGDTRLFDPAVGNNTFNGRNHNQYILFEDYDGDGRDDTPPDVHYEAGMGCIDCHGTEDLHGADVASGDERILSRMEQAVAIRCENCHGTVDAYAATQQGTSWDGTTRQIAMDDDGHPLPHVYKDSNGDYWLRSRLTGQLHYIRQTRDVVVDSGKLDPVTSEVVYSERASYAMGRADGDPSTGTGPIQSSGPSGFRHGDNMTCQACHSSWTNSCIGCHLEGEYNNGNNFSNITGERIVFRQKFADFVYQTPVPFQLGVGVDDKITVTAPNTDAFFRWDDRGGVRSQVFAFTDRNGHGNAPAQPSLPSLSHNSMMPHSIRGKVEATEEGPRYCVACHLTTNGLANWRTEYDQFRTQMAAQDFASLDYNLLKTHIGQNTGNELDSPLWVHMVAGLGSGLFLFDQNGCPVNPLDDNPDRKGCDGIAPSAMYDPTHAVLDLDRIVDENGVATGSSAHPLRDASRASTLRDGSLDPNMAGPLGQTLIQRLTDPDNGVVLDSWIDADGNLHGGASTWIQN